jgi:type II secretory pathway pseudopilin PulG
MKIKGKKGIEKTLLAVMIIAIIAGMIIFFLFVSFAEQLGGEAGSSFLTSLCNSNTWLKTKITGPLGQAHPVPLFMCKVRARTIYADKWSVCDPKDDFGLKKYADKNKAKKECAAIQVAKLAKECFNMYGSDSDNYRFSGTPERAPCFNIAIKHLSDQTINEVELTNAMRKLGPDLGFCGNGFSNNDCAGFATDPCDAGQPSNCGDHDNINWYGDLASADKARPAPRKDFKVRYNTMCYDTRGDPVADAVNINDFDCPGAPAVKQTCLSGGAAKKTNERPEATEGQLIQ